MYFDIFLNGKFFDTAYFSYRLSAYDAKQKLIADGHSSDIKVIEQEEQYA